MKKEFDLSKGTRNPYRAKALNRQKFIITRIEDSDGNIEVHRERNPDYQWNLFNPLIKIYCLYRERRIHKKLKQSSPSSIRG